VEKTLASLTLREKIGQTINERAALLPVRAEAEIAAYLERHPLGSLFCGGEIIGEADASSRVIRDSLRLFQKHSRVPLLVAGDLENGAGATVRGLTAFPRPMTLGAADDEELAYQYGRFTALEGRAAGFTWTFAPVVDLSRNWLNPVVSTRSFGSDPGRVARLARAVIRGMQEHGLAACAKHFPGDGIDFRDQHLVTSVNSLPEKEWRASFGRVFEGAIAAGVESIMSGHIALPWREGLPGKGRPRPATVSGELLDGLLRREMGFAGVIVSDALEMAGFTGWAPYERRLIEAFNAGNDILLWPKEGAFGVLERAVEEGIVPIERLDASVRRILRLKFRLGLAGLAADGSDPRALPLTEGGGLAPDLASGARRVAAAVAEKGITLVRNEERLLPLDPGAVRRVLLHKAVNPFPGRRDDLSLLETLLRARGIEVTVIENGNCLDVWNLEAKGERFDAYLVVFSLQIHQAKNTVRPVGSMGEVMWTLQNADTLRPVVVSCGSPFLLRDMPFLATLVNAYSPDEGTLVALDRALFGEIPFTSFSPVDAGGEWIESCK